MTAKGQGAAPVTGSIQRNLRSGADERIRLGAMITMKQPEPGTADAESDSLASAITVRLDADADPESFGDLIVGLITAAGLLGMPETHIFAPAELMPQLAVAAGEMDNIPEEFQLHQINHPEDGIRELPVGSTPLTVESLVRLARSPETV